MYQPFLLGLYRCKHNTLAILLAEKHYINTLSSQGPLGNAKKSSNLRVLTAFLLKGKLELKCLN